MKSINIFIIAIILFSSISLTGNRQVQLDFSKERLKTSFILPHAPIVIISNDDFADQATTGGWNGTGISTDPYIIDNYEITIITNDSAGIAIVNTDVHFIIRNCQIVTSGAIDNSGIYLETVRNGILANNTITIDEGHGMLVIDSSNCTIQDNEVKNCFSHCAVHLFESPNNIIVNNILANNLRGISLYASSNSNIIQENTISNSSQYGIYLFNSADYNLISLNELVDNEIGIWFFYTFNNTVMLNKFVNNGEGISLTANSFYNTIYLNEFIDNGIGAVQDYTTNMTNIFFKDTAGNYWSDYNGTDLDKNGIGDTVYSIDNATGTSDPYPITYPENAYPELNSPVDRSYTEGTTGINITWIAGDENPWIYDIHINNSPYSTDVEWTNGSITVNTEGLIAGNHLFIITIYDRFGNVKTDTVVVRVLPGVFFPLNEVLLAGIAIIAIAGIASLGGLFLRRRSKKH